MADFNRAYDFNRDCQAMVRDGTVNRILGLEWLATDLVLADDTAYETPEAAMRTLESGQRCRYDNRTATIVCAGR